MLRYFPLLKHTFDKFRIDLVLTVENLLQAIFLGIGCFQDIVQVLATLVRYKCIGEVSLSASFRDTDIGGDCYRNNSSDGDDDGDSLGEYDSFSEEDDKYDKDGRNGDDDGDGVGEYNSDCGGDGHDDSDGDGDGVGKNYSDDGVGDYDSGVRSLGEYDSDSGGFTKQRNGYFCTPIFFSETRKNSPEFFFQLAKQDIWTSGFCIQSSIHIM